MSEEYELLSPTYIEALNAADIRLLGDRIGAVAGCTLRPSQLNRTF